MKHLFTLLILISSPLFAQEWNEVNLWLYDDNVFSVTSELDDGVEDEGWNTKYGGVNLFDGSYTTAWVEGVKGDGIGQSIWVSIPDNCQTINIFTGYGKSPTTFSSNNRVKSIKLSCHVGINPSGYVTEMDLYTYKMLKFPKEANIDLNDVQNLQTFIFPFSNDEINEFKQKVLTRYPKDFEAPVSEVHVFLHLEIESVYKGSKWDDTCISELFFNNTYVSDNRELKYPLVEKIYTDKGNDSRIMIDTPEKKQIVIVDDSKWIFQISEVSANNFWATVIRMPAEVGPGRTETEYMIIDTRLGKVLNVEIERTLGKLLYGPFFLKDQEGSTFLEHSSGMIRLR